jgi:hypothetical protein
MIEILKRIVITTLKTVIVLTVYLGSIWIAEKILKIRITTGMELITYYILMQYSLLTGCFYYFWLEKDSLFHLVNFFLKWLLLSGGGLAGCYFGIHLHLKWFLDETPMFYGMHISIILGTIIAFMWESKNYFILLKLGYAFWYLVTFFYFWSKGYGFTNVLTNFYFFWAEVFFIVTTLIFIFPWILSFLREPWAVLPKLFVELIRSFGRLFITMYFMLFFSFSYCYFSLIQKYGEQWWKECIVFNNKYFFVQYDFLNHVDLFDWINLVFY